MPEKKKQKTYAGKFNVEAVETMRNENLSYKETARRFGLGTHPFFIASQTRTFENTPLSAECKKMHQKL